MASANRNAAGAMNKERGYGISEIPRFVQYTTPVLESPSRTVLPLNLLARIIGYVDDPGDIARLTRTSRLLYYMTLPQLYQRVSLHSYAETRYVNGRPEGFGSGSPFTMALNGLMTGSHAAMVQELRLWGAWREVGVEDFAKGRVPDNSMMLNIILRACLDKMKKLHSFCWELDCKPLKTLYQGLAGKDGLTSLTLRFPSSRLPRPSVIIPAMPNLLAFKAFDIDPLCYPDDISLLLLGSKKLQDVRLHFSPRMRCEAEPTLSLDTYFGRCFQANYVPKLKHFAMQNWFGPRSHAFYTLFDGQVCKSMAFLDTFGGAAGGSANVYVDDTWRDVPSTLVQSFRTIRFNEPATQHVDMIKNTHSLEHVYVVSDRKGGRLATSASPTSNSSDTYITPDDSPAQQPPSPSVRAEIEDLGKKYIHAFTHQHGSTLKHLLLSDQWPLTEDDATELIRLCPNLTQLGFAVNFSNSDTLRLLLRFLPKLEAVRILDSEFAREQMSLVSEDEMAEFMSKDMARFSQSKLRWTGVGKRVFRVGENCQHWCESADGAGKWEWRREVRVASREEVEREGVEIWAMDKLDCMVDKGAGVG